MIEKESRKDGSEVDSEVQDQDFDFDSVVENFEVEMLVVRMDRWLLLLQVLEAVVRSVD